MVQVGVGFQNDFLVVQADKMGWSFGFGRRYIYGALVSKQVWHDNDRPSLPYGCRCDTRIWTFVYGPSAGWRFHLNEIVSNGRKKQTINQLTENDGVL